MVLLKQVWSAAQSAPDYKPYALIQPRRCAHSTNPCMGSTDSFLRLDPPPRILSMAILAEQSPPHHSHKPCLAHDLPPCHASLQGSFCASNHCETVRKPEKMVISCSATKPLP